MSLPRYPEYKDSGADWLGFIPAHWGIKPLKHGADFVNGCAFKPEQWEESGTPIIRIENLNGSLSFNYVTGDVDTRYHVEEDDLLFGWSGNRGTSFGPFLWPHSGKHYLNQHIFRICNFEFFKKWFYWTLKAVTFHVEEQAHGIIGMVHVTKGELGSIKVPVPPIAEQTAIATFLDHEAGKIDALIAEQEQLIALLAEKRQATISHAVTKGLNPDVTMKDSGVAWLGEVPEHWRVSPLKYLVTFSSGGTPSKDNLDYWDGEIPWASAKDLKVERLHDTGDHITQYAIDSGAASLLPAGTVLVVVRGMILARTFPVTQIAVPMAINQDLKGLKAASTLNSSFLAWLLRGSANESLQRLDEAGHGTKALRMDGWSSMQLPVPPKNEQAEIADFLETETAKLDSLKTESENAINLLKERRSALIAAAVAGQIDVCGLHTERIAA